MDLYICTIYNIHNTRRLQLTKKELELRVAELEELVTKNSIAECKVCKERNKPSKRIRA